MVPGEYFRIEGVPGKRYVFRSAFSDKTIRCTDVYNGGGRFFDAELPFIPVKKGK